MNQIFDVKNRQSQSYGKFIRPFVSTFSRICKRSGLTSASRVGAFFLTCAIILVTGPQTLVVYAAAQSTSQSGDDSAQDSPEELQQLVAPNRVVPRCAGGTDTGSLYLPDSGG
jgi:hypothetical protein